MTSGRWNPAVVVVGAGVAAALQVGKLPTALPVLREQLHITLVEAAFLLSLVQLAGMLFGLAVGLAADSMGLRRTMLRGLALIAVASALGALANDAYTLMALRALEGVGVLLTATPAPSLIRRVVGPDRVDAAMGLWGTYMPIGTAVALLAGPLVIQFVDWRGWWALLAGIAALAAVVVWQSVPGDPAHTTQVARGLWTERLRCTLRTSGPWLIAIAFGLYSAQWLSVIGFLPTVYAQAGFAATYAGAATALAALVNMVGNIAAGRLLQRGVAPTVLLLAGFATMAAGALLAFAAGFVPAGAQYAGVLAFSMVGGLVPATLFALSVRLAPRDDTVSTTVGWMQQWSSLGQFTGPPVVAYVAAAVGGWQWSGAVTATLALAGIGVAAAISALIHERR